MSDGDRTEWGRGWDKDGHSGRTRREGRGEGRSTEVSGDRGEGTVIRGGPYFRNKTPTNLELTVKGRHPRPLGEHCKDTSKIQSVTIHFRASFT